MKLKRFVVLALFVVGFSGCANLSENWVKVRDTVVETTFETTAGLASKVVEESFKAASTIVTETVESASEVFEQEDSED